ncbi:hypothetical protein C8F01DRAFT_1368308 [Mycena amicta]|nr:hypothetical protein C8F01DRAFT_1368308 [Mycena amicta]
MLVRASLRRLAPSAILIRLRASLVLGLGLITAESSVPASNSAVTTRPQQVIACPARRCDLVPSSRPDADRIPSMHHKTIRIARAASGRSFTLPPRDIVQLTSDKINEMRGHVAAHLQWTTDGWR